MNKMLIATGIVAGVCAFSAMPTMAAATQPDFICPDGNGWVKVDGPFGQAVLALAPEGQLIAEVCYKAGPNSTTYTVESVRGVSITSTLLNNGGQVADISHYSLRLVPVPEITPTPQPTATVTPTPEPTNPIECPDGQRAIPTEDSYLCVTPVGPPLEDREVLAETGAGSWFWALLGVGAALTLTGWIAVRYSHDSSTTNNEGALL